MWVVPVQQPCAGCRQVRQCLHGAAKHADGYAFAQGEAIMIMYSLHTISFRILDSVTSVSNRTWLSASGQVLTSADGLQLGRRLLDLRNAVRSRFGLTLL